MRLKLVCILGAILFLFIYMCSCVADSGQVKNLNDYSDYSEYKIEKVASYKGSAPVQEMNTLYEIRERIITDDPIVFSTVGNGVIIYSMWGDEGNDEVMRKYQELNKFIAENVNLGTITESKETVS